MKRILPLALVAMVIVYGCKSTQTTQKPTTQGKYSEDLSSLRPKVQDQPDDQTTVPDNIKRDPKAYVEAQFTVNKRLDAVLDSIDQINLSHKTIDGYTIQVYSGTNREDALNAKRQLTLSIPNRNSEIQYEQPNFKVKAGKYFNKLEAQKDFDQIRRIFPSAIVVPSQISIN